jgi:hypothetical protein
MSVDGSRRGFLQGLLATIGSATLVRTVRPADVPALAGLPAEEAMEYEPGLAAGASMYYASVRRGPLRLDKNFGFRYVARGGELGSGVRLYYERGPCDIHFVVPVEEQCEGLPVVMMVGPIGRDWVEVMAYKNAGGSFNRVEVDFDILVMRPALVSR